MKSKSLFQKYLVKILFVHLVIISIFIALPFTMVPENVSALRSVTHNPLSLIPLVYIMFSIWEEYKYFKKFKQGDE